MRSALLVPCLACLIGQAGDGPKPEAPYRGKILFLGATRKDQPGGVILSMNADGTGLAPVVEFKEPTDVRGRVSPDGKRLAMSILTDRGYSNRISIREADGTSRDVAGNVAVMAWSPDGGSLVGSRPLKEEGWKNAIVDLGAGTARKLDLDRGDAVEDWSPVGDRISIMASNEEHVVERAPGDIYPLRQIDLAASDGTGRKRLTSDPLTDNIWSRFSPDGSKVIHYQRKIIDGRPFESYVVRGVDGGDPVEFLRCSRLGADLKTGDEVLKPFYWTPHGPACWSPDGKRVAVIVDNGKWLAKARPRPRERRSVLLIVTLDGRIEKSWELKDMGINFAGHIEWR